MILRRPLSLAGLAGLLAASVVAVAAGAAAARDPALAVGGAFALVAAAAVFAAPRVGLYLLIAAMPWESYLPSPHPELTTVKLLGAVLVGAYVLRLLTTPAQSPHRPRSLPWVVAFLGIAILSLLASPDAADGAMKTARYAAYAVFFYVALQFVQDRATLVRVLRVLVLSAAAAAVAAIVAWIRSDAGRAVGPIGDPNDLAYLLAALVPVALYLLASDARHRLLWAFASGALVAGTVATLSRGALVGLVAALAWFLLSGRVRARTVAKGAVALLLVGAAVLTLAGDFVEERVERRQRYSTASRNVDDRTALWNAAIRMGIDRPVLGVGPNRFDDELPDYVRGVNLGTARLSAAHNSYLEVLSENGVPALAMFVAFLVATWRIARRARVAAPEAASLATALQATLLVAIVAGTFISAQLNTPFWIIGALIPAVAQHAGSAAARPRP